MNSSPCQLIAQAGRTTEEVRFEFAALPEGWGAVVALAVLLITGWAVLWMYRTEGRRGASSATRMFLAALRCTVILLLFLIFLQPVLATYLHRWIDSYCIVLIDDSSSMDLRDHYRDTEDAQRVRSVMPPEAPFPVRRADVVTGLLESDNRRLLDEITARNRAKVYVFSEAPELIASLRARHERSSGTPAGTPLSGDPQGSDPDLAASPALGAASASERSIPTAFAAQGAATNLSRAIRRSIESLGGAPLAGIVLFSDGGFNRGDPVDVVARYLEERNIPLHVVGIGDASPPRNVRITEVIAPENAFKDDPLSITAHVATQGMAGETISLQLYAVGDDAGGTDTLLESRTVTVRADGGVDPVSFTQIRETVGRAVFRVEVPVGADESVSDDNAKQTIVNVIDDKMRVLLIAGGPGWEYRYVSRLLMRDSTFDVSCWLQSADVEAVRDGNTIIETLPESAEELFVYDAVILLDPDSSDFGPGWARSLETLVTEHGSGVAYVAARAHTPHFMRDPAVRRIVQLLPVTPDPEADLILNRAGHYQMRAWAMEIPPEAYGHSILRHGDDAMDTQEYWKDTPGIYWHYPVLREKPVATVLIRHSNPQMRNAYGGHVLLATQFVGAGRAAFLAFDSTWRWRRQGQEKFDAFWVRLLRYLVEGKLVGAKNRATLFTEGESFQLGEAVNVTARLFDARFKPFDADTVAATYRVGSHRRGFTLKRLPDRPGWFEGRFTPDQTGGYEISLTLPAVGGTEAVTATQNLQVVRPNIEIINPQMNRAALVALAERSPGGRYYEIDELDELTEAIPDRHELTTVKSPPKQLWDRWWTLAMLVGLLSIEWTVRKWVRLL